MQTVEIFHSGQKQVNGRVFPKIIKPEPSAKTPSYSLEDLFEWGEKNKSEFREELMTYGAILLRDFPFSCPNDFEHFLDVSGFPRMPYVGGAAPRSKVTKGRVLTSNESPPSEPIPFHHEMAQVPNPPAYIFFYCDLPCDIGGETAIAHSNHIYQKFQVVGGEFAKKVEKTGVRYIRIMPEEDDSTSAIGRSWKSTFIAKTKEEAEMKMKELGTTWQWLSDGNVRTETTTIPAIRTDERTGLKTFFNSMVAAYTGWVDSRNDPTKSVCCGDGSAVDGNVLTKMATILNEEAAIIPWQKGDVLLIDNKLVLHSRRPFEGPRKILASIAPH